MSNDALGLLVDTMPRWAVGHRTTNKLIVRATATLPSKREMKFTLEVTLRANTISVTECAPRTIPLDCPERHVYEDGSFCLGRYAPEVPRTNEYARMWWELLGGYLDLQVVAHHLGEWEKKFAWAHGARAADLQARIEILEKGSGSRREIRELAKLRVALSDAIQAFWDARRGRVCCGTMNTCAQRDSTALIYRSRREFRCGADRIVARK